MSQRQMGDVEYHFAVYGCVSAVYGSVAEGDIILVGGHGIGGIELDVKGLGGRHDGRSVTSDSGLPIQ